MDEALFATLPPLLAFSLIRTASQVTVLKLLVSQRDVSASMSTCPIIAILTDTVKHVMLSNLLQYLPEEYDDNYTDYGDERALDAAQDMLFVQEHACHQDSHQDIEPLHRHNVGRIGQAHGMILE